MSFITELIERKDLKLTDADHDLDVEITAGDIKASRRKDATHCAFAVAVKREEHAVAAYFFRSCAYVEYKDKSLVRYELPDSVRSEIVSFDRSGEMDPGYYRLRPPRPSSRRGVRKPSGKKDHKKPSKGKRKPQHITQNIRSSLKSYAQ